MLDGAGARGHGTRAIDAIVLGAFSEYGALEDRVALPLLELYDTLTRSDLARRLPQPTADAQRLLRDFDRELRVCLEDALLRGAIVVERVTLAPWPFVDEEAPPTIRTDDLSFALASATAIETWIEIELLGEDDKPIPGVAYRIVLPDGSVRDGRLDFDGLARVTGIDPGKCAVAFPELDGEAWTRAGGGP
jgi:hypothetical protein